MMEQYSFLLAKNGKAIGRVRWFVDIDQHGYGRLEGDEPALVDLNQTIRMAVAEKWSAYLPPSSETVTDPLNSFYEMMIVLEYGGYDIPDEFYPYTPKGSAERDAQFADTGTFIICH
ncbi:hypothetical protein [Conchiformibius steedae]|uniref:hypothetical protein n=1 Tax=Conchiformibius steedae TaxID=153493 RepID=UPI0026ED520E|nr:hypothetical protein [Conchiformibius steedae]